MAEVLLYHTILTPVQQGQLYNYLYGKWISGNGTLFSTATAAFTVSPAPRSTITGRGLLADNKAYDGTTNCVLTIGSVTTNSVFAPDTGNVSVNTGAAVGYFANAGPGVNIPVTVTGLTLSGSAAGDYVLAPLGLMATITPGQPPFSAFTITDSGHGSATAGSPDTLTVTAVNADGTTNTGVSGSIVLTFGGLGKFTGRHGPRRSTAPPVVRPRPTSSAARPR